MKKTGKVGAEGRVTETSPAVLRTSDDLWLAALGARLLQELEGDGANLLTEFKPGALATQLRRGLTAAQRAHLDYVTQRLLEWR